MSTRTIAGAVERIRQLAITDPCPDARAAYEVVLNLLGRVDECELADLIEATAPRPLPCFPREYPIFDTTQNPNAVFDADFSSEVA